MRVVQVLLFCLRASSFCLLRRSPRVSSVVCQFEDNSVRKKKTGNYGSHPSLTNFAVAADYVTKELAFSALEVKKLEDRLVGRAVRYDRANATIAALSSRLGLKPDELKRVVLHLPAILGYDYERNIEPKLTFLQQRLQLTKWELRKIVVTTPAVLSYSIDQNLAPKIDYLEQHLEIDIFDLALKIIAFPPLLTYSLSKRYQPRFDLCRQHRIPLEIAVHRITLTDDKFNGLVNRLRYS